MKHLPLLLAASLLLVAAFPASALAQTPPAVTEYSRTADRDDEGPLTEPRHISFRMAPEEVVNAMKGPPDEKFSADIWVYWNFRSVADADLQKFDTLIVMFAQGRVHTYRLVERKSVVALLVESRQRAKAAATVAKK